jgi:hypothetical protein
MLGLIVSVALMACTSHSGIHQAPRLLPAHWAKFIHLPGVVDLGPRGDGSLVVAAAGRLSILSRTGMVTAFARGPAGYSTKQGPEPYLTVAGTDAVAGSRCSFHSGTIFALQPGSHPGVVMIGADGRARRFASLAAAMPTGIAFDASGHFGHRLLVTTKSASGSAVLAIDCAGRIEVVTGHAPAVEGGITVAPDSFGRFAGDLIAPDERTGRIYAIRPGGAVVLLAASGLPHGGDIGVESAGFVPPGFAPGDAAFLADRFSKGNRHPGTNSILRLAGSELIKAGVRPGDLLVASEASARTIVVRCTQTCTVRYVAAGPAITHAEGHIAFARF